MIRPGGLPDEDPRTKPTPNSTSTVHRPIRKQLVADLECELAEAQRKLAERDGALQQQTAIAKVLQVVNSSPGDLAPVFEAILEKALRLFGGAFGFLNTHDGARFQIAAILGVPAPFAVGCAIQPGSIIPRPRGAQLWRPRRIPRVLAPGT